VVLPVRDGDRTLDGAIRSVLASRDCALELICIDDGSRDATGAILAALGATDRRVRVLRTQGLGISGALNLGLEAAGAPYVARMDADDEMHPERLAAQRALLDARPDVALVGCRVESFRDGGLAGGYRIYTRWVNDLVDPDDIERQAFVECPIPHPTWMFRRSAALEIGGYREDDWPEDLDLLYRLLEAGGRLAKLPRTLHRWRDHPDRLSRTDPRYDRVAFARVKAHYLPRLHPMSAAVVWGAGRTGRRFARLLSEEGLEIRAFLDNHPSRIGTSWHGIPILSHQRLAEHTDAWRREGVPVLGAVASRGARGEIRGELEAAGLREGREFWMVA
jgi:glycosyltransferase involved in cell wall biosynthesis